MHQTANLHFDLSHLAPNQPYTLHAGASRYDLSPHTRQTLTQARRGNSALRLMRDDGVTHFAGPVRLPGNAPVLLRVTAPKLRADDPLERLVLVSLYLPRRVRIAGAARRRQLGRPVRLPPKLTGRALGDTAGLPPDDELIGDIGDITTAEDAAASQAADFSSAFVSNCDFAQASLYGVIFTGATLVSGNILEASAPGLQEADFTNAYLPDADFTGASLQGAKFDGAFMVGCVLSDADLSPAEQGAVSASLDGTCLQGAALDGANLAGANLDNAAITDARGMIMQQYYGEDGQLTPPAEMRYQASDFPVAASFSDETVCPNGDTYAVNVDASLTIAQMMVAPHPPTSWAPRDLGRKAEGQRTKQSNRNITDHG
jgi:hypothetical protein